MLVLFGDTNTKLATIILKGLFWYCTFTERQSHVDILTPSSKIMDFSVASLEEAR